MKTKTINLYEFRELDEKAQEKVLNYFRDKEDFEFLYEVLKDYLMSKLKNKKITPEGKTELFYSLNHSQGDGLCFTGIFDFKFNTFIIKKDSSLYNHKNTVNIMAYDEAGNDLDPNDKTFNEFESYYSEICDELEEDAYTNIDEYLSDEYIKDMIEMNEYYFTKEGVLE